MNLYGFVGNDGVNWIDYLGLKLTVKGDAAYRKALEDLLKKLCPSAKVAEDGSVSIGEDAGGDGDKEGCCCLKRLIENDFNNTIGDHGDDAIGPDQRAPITRGENPVDGIWDGEPFGGDKGTPGPGTAGRVIIDPTVESQESWTGKEDSWTDVTHIALGHELCGHVEELNQGKAYLPGGSGPIPQEEKNAIEQENKLRKDADMKLRRDYTRNPFMRHVQK